MPLNFAVARTYFHVPFIVPEPSFFICAVPSKRTTVLSPLSMTLVLYPWLLATDPVMSPMETSTVGPGLLPSIVKGVAQVQFAFWNMIIWPMSPPVWLTLGLAHVNLPEIFVC